MGCGQDSHFNDDDEEDLEPELCEGCGNFECTCDEFDRPAETNIYGGEPE